MKLAPLLIVLALQAAQPAPAPTFEEFLAGVRTEALARGLSEATVASALSNLELQPVVVARDRAQPEQVQSLDAYLAQRLTARTIGTARERAARHAELLARIQTKYGVPAPIMIAIWGLESNFGKFTGTYPTIAALATLAYDGRRPLFREELLQALAIVELRGLAPADLKGSWAGAMGQPQFMPSSFLKHAVDFDGDQQIDIWSSEADVFGSMANYLSSAGWRDDERWGREVKISRAAMTRIDRAVPMRTAGCRAVRALTAPRPLTEWRKLGVTLASGQPLPSSTLAASLVRGQRRHFLVYRNYEAILDYNCSNSYAVSVGVLADKISVK
jgi:membrane-bound lytic murein transglycosylase B